MSQFQSKHPGAFELGKVIFDLAQGCYAFEAIIQAAQDASIAALVPRITPVPGGALRRKDGSQHTYDVVYYLTLGKDHAFIAPEIRRSWFSGVLITAGDLLKKHGYFDHGPELELIYHLRNGVAHGNRFNFTPSGEKRLGKHPAYNRVLDGRGEVFHITAGLKGQSVLFDFMAAADVVDLLTMAAERLKDLERGILGPGVSTSIFG